MHALASHLHTSVAAVERGMSAREFNSWLRWMDQEQAGPRWERVRHAELLAAVHNGACERRGGGLFSAADFLPQPQPETPEHPDRQALRAELARMWGNAA
jgi:hypothetical protein